MCISTTSNYDPNFDQPPANVDSFFENPVQNDKPTYNLPSYEKIIKLMQNHAFIFQGYPNFENPGRSTFIKFDQNKESFILKIPSFIEENNEKFFEIELKEGLVCRGESLALTLPQKHPNLLKTLGLVIQDTKTDELTFNQDLDFIKKVPVQNKLIVGTLIEDLSDFDDLFDFLEYTFCPNSLKVLTKTDVKTILDKLKNSNIEDIPDLLEDVLDLLNAAYFKSDLINSKEKNIKDILDKLKDSSSKKLNNSDIKNILNIPENLDIEKALDILNETKQQYIKQTKSLILQLAYAIKAVHEKGLGHRDIKPENILVKVTPPSLSSKLNNQDPEYFLKLIDFGFSRNFNTEPRHRSNTSCGSLFYVAPEVLIPNEETKEISYNKKADLWSFGVILYSMFYNNYPDKTPKYDEEGFIIGIDKLQDYIKEKKQAEPLTPDVEYTDEQLFQNLIDNLLCKEEFRFTIDEVINHPFFSSVKKSVDNTSSE